MREKFERLRTEVSKICIGKFLLVSSNNNGNYILSSNQCIFRTNEKIMISCSESIFSAAKDNAVLLGRLLFRC